MVHGVGFWLSLSPVVDTSSFKLETFGVKFKRLKHEESAVIVGSELLVGSLRPSLIGVVGLESDELALCLFFFDIRGDYRW